VDGDALQRLCGNRPAGCDPAVSDLSLFVSLFKAITASRDSLKSEVLATVAKRLIAARERALRSFNPVAKPQLYRIVDALRGFLASHPVPVDLCECLCQITSKVLDDLGDFGNTDEHPRIEDLLKLFRTQEPYHRFWQREGPEWHLHRIWELILLDLRELAPRPLDVDALTQPGSSGPIDHYSRLLDNLQVIFPNKPAKQLLRPIAKLAAAHGLDVTTLRSGDSPLDGLMCLPPLCSKLKPKPRQNWWFFYVTCVVALFFGGIAMGVLYYWQHPLPPPAWNWNEHNHLFVFLLTVSCCAMLVPLGYEILHVLSPTPKEKTWRGEDLRMCLWFIGLVGFSVCLGILLEKYAPLYQRLEPTSSGNAAPAATDSGGPKTSGGTIAAPTSFQVSPKAGANLKAVDKPRTASRVENGSETKPPTPKSTGANSATPSASGQQKATI
jgi:hypothetical protein